MNTTTKKTNTGIEHLDAIINDINSLITNKQDFLGFIIIALGIEFMGNFYDGNDFNDFSQSKIRFKNGLTKLFKNNWYKNNSDWLFENFRGPLIHQYRPSDLILLTSKCKNGFSLDLHLKLVDGKRIFVLEKLFDDFGLAAKKLKNDSQRNHSLNKTKMNGEFMALVNIHLSPGNKIFGIPYQALESSGTLTFDSSISKKKGK